MIDQNMESVPYPGRKVAFTFEHDTIEDGRFWPMIRAAFAEMGAADPNGSIDQFAASNGVRITVTWPADRTLEQLDADEAAYRRKLAQEKGSNDQATGNGDA